MAVLSHWPFFFLESRKKKNPLKRGRSGGSHNTQALLSKLITSQPLPRNTHQCDPPLPGLRPRFQDPTTAASPSLPGLCSLSSEASTTGSLFGREKAWTSRPAPRCILSPRYNIGSKKKKKKGRGAECSHRVIKMPLLNRVTVI